MSLASTSSETASQRILKELSSLHKQPTEGITVEKAGDELFHWQATIADPEESPYQGKVFKVCVIFGGNSPKSPPKVSFVTKIYHPNINSNGDILKEGVPSKPKEQRWRTDFTMKRVFLAIIQLMKYPNPDEPLLPDIAKIYKNDREKFNALAREYARE